MIKNIEKFKKQCEEYNSFIDNIKTITNDYCILLKKENNPFINGRSIKYKISKNEIYISWEEEHYACGSYTEYYNLTIPLNFYEKISQLEIEYIEKEKRIKVLKKEKDNLNNKRYKLVKELQSLNNDKKTLSKYNSDTNELDNKMIDLKKEIKIIDEKLDNLNLELKGEEND